jgi:3-dehydroquinate synthase
MQARIGGEEIIFVESNISSELQMLLGDLGYSKLVIIADDNTAEYCLPLLGKAASQAEVVTIPSGESHKVLDTCQHIWAEMTRLHIDRQALVMNLGGGVVGDMGGFCAATFKRGLRFIQIPTTLLAQVDASVGGKLGIDFMGYKNHIGLYQLPLKTIIDTNFLKTLPQEQLLSVYEFFKVS